MKIFLNCQPIKCYKPLFKSKEPVKLEEFLKKVPTEWQKKLNIVRRNDEYNNSTYM